AGTRKTRVFPLSRDPLKPALPGLQSLLHFWRRSVMPPLSTIPVRFTVCLVLTLCTAIPLSAKKEQDADPPEVALGERLFLETRFAQFFREFLNKGHGVNATPPAGDPVMNTTAKAQGAPLPGPFAGASMNCRQCHLVDEQVGVAGGGMRTYNDFARR